MVFSTPLHKIPPFLLFPVPSWLWLGLLPLPCHWPASRLIGATNLFSPHPGGSPRVRRGERREGSAVWWRSPSVTSSSESRSGDDRRRLCWTLTGLTHRLCLRRLSSISMSSSSANLHNKRLPCKSLFSAQSYLISTACYFSLNGHGIIYAGAGFIFRMEGKNSLLIWLREVAAGTRGKI